MFFSKKYFYFQNFPIFMIFCPKSWKSTFSDPRSPNEHFWDYFPCERCFSIIVLIRCPGPCFRHLKTEPSPANPPKPGSRAFRSVRVPPLETAQNHMIFKLKHFLARRMISGVVNFDFFKYNLCLHRLHIFIFIFFDFEDLFVQNHENRLFPIRDHQMTSSEITSL